MITKQKCLYTLLGAGIMLLGTIVGSVFAPLGAQDEIGSYRELYCNGLYILDPETGKQVAALDHKPALRMWNKNKEGNSLSVNLHANEGHGSLGLLDADESPRHLLLSHDEHEGASHVMADKNGNVGVRLTSNDIIGGMVKVYWNSNQRWLFADKNFDPSTLIVREK